MPSAWPAVSSQGESPPPTPASQQSGLQALLHQFYSPRWCQHQSPCLILLVNEMEAMSSFYTRKETLMPTSCRKPPRVAASFPQNTRCLRFCHEGPLCKPIAEHIRTPPPTPPPAAGGGKGAGCTAHLAPPAQHLGPEALRAGSGGLGAAGPGHPQRKKVPTATPGLCCSGHPSRDLAPRPSPSCSQPPLPDAVRNSCRSRWPALGAARKARPAQEFPQERPTPHTQAEGLGRAAPASVYKSAPKLPWNVKQR